MNKVVRIGARAATVAMLVYILAITSACSVKFEAGYHGQTGRDDRVISPTLYPDGISQKRGSDQRY
jgi:hypothetical protein